MLFIDRRTIFHQFQIEFLPAHSGNVLENNWNQTYFNIVVQNNTKNYFEDMYIELRLYLVYMMNEYVFLIVCSRRRWKINIFYMLNRSFFLWNIFLLEKKKWGEFMWIMNSEIGSTDFESEWIVITWQDCSISLELSSFDRKLAIENNAHFVLIFSTCLSPQS